MMHRHPIRIAALLLSILVTGCATVAPEPQPPANPPGLRASLVNFTLAGNITKVEDGDTLTIQGRGGVSFNVRLSDIDSPEVSHARNPSKDRCPAGPVNAPGQAFGSAAAAALAAMAPRGTPVVAECYEVDPYNRLVCHVFAGSTNLNLEQLRRGWAMTLTNPKWVRDPDSAREAAGARQREVGIWSLANPVAPEKWRKDCWCDGVCRGGE